MTPAERLLAAANLLDKLSWGATDGPWVEAGYGEFGWAVTDRAKTFGVETEDSDQGRADAAYIAAMNPEIGRTLAVAMRTAARSAQKVVREGCKPPRLVDRLVEVADALLSSSGEGGK